MGDMVMSQLGKNGNKGMSWEHWGHGNVMAGWHWKQGDVMVKGVGGHGDAMVGGHGDRVMSWQEAMRGQGNDMVGMAEHDDVAAEVSWGMG